MAIQNPGMDTQNREKNENRLSIEDVGPRGRNDPDGYGDEQGDHDGKEHHFQGGGQPLGDEVQDLLVSLERAAQGSPGRHCRAS